MFLSAPTFLHQEKSAHFYMRTLSCLIQRSREWVFCVKIILYEKSAYGKIRPVDLFRQSVWIDSYKVNFMELNPKKEVIMVESIGAGDGAGKAAVSFMSPCGIGLIPLPLGKHFSIILNHGTRRI